MSRCAPMPVLKELAREAGHRRARAGAGATDTCILCGLCVRVCDEIVGAQALGFASRGTDSRRHDPVRRRLRRLHPLRRLRGALSDRAHPDGGDRAAGRSSTREITLGPNAAISVPFRQAVPNVPRIDPEYCVHFRTGGCMVCAQVCPKECIDHEDEERIEEVEVGTVVLATGFQDLDPGAAEAVRLRPAAQRDHLDGIRADEQRGRLDRREDRSWRTARSRARSRSCTASAAATRTTTPTAAASAACTP